MKVQKFIEVRLLKKRIIPDIDLVQYDTGIQLVFSLVDFDIPSGTSATLYVQKRSGKFVYQEEGITVSGNEITIDLENQALTEHGETKYQIMLKNGTDTVTTFAGVLRIEKSLADANAVESKTVIRAFDEAVADHVAEFQTKAEQIVQACIATIPEDYTVMEAKVNELASAVKGNLSGDVVFAEDVSTVEHNPVVKVHGKNLFDVSKLSNITGKLTNNNDGTLTIAAKQYAIPTGKKINELCPSLKSGDVCTLSFFSTSATTKYIWLNGANVMLYNGTYTFTYQMLNSELYLYGFRDTDEGYGSVCTISNIQVEEGTVATDYEPYIDPSTVTVTRCGKNLLHIRTENEQTVSGVKFVFDKDGRCTVSGTNTETDLIDVYATTTTSGIKIKKGTTVTISGLPDNPKCCLRVFTNTTTGNTVGGLQGDYYATQTITVTEDTIIQNVLVRVAGGATVNVVFEPMLEIGDTATAFERFKEPETHIPAADGTVSGLTSVSPNMTILTDTEGAIVECEYNRDTNKVIEKLTNAIIALGGTV